MSMMHIETALRFARGEYDEPTLRLEFRAVAMMQDIVEKLFLAHEPAYQGHTTNSLHHSLIQLVGRHQLSADLQEGIRMAYEMTIGELIADEQFLGDVKYWDTLGQGARSGACDVAVKVFAEYLKRYAFLHTEELPRIEIHDSHHEVPYVDYDGNTRSYHPTVRSFPHFEQDCEHVIVINAQKKGNFNDPFHVIPSVLGEFVSLKISDLQHISHDYRRGRHIYQEDLDLLKAMDDEHALIKPYLDAARSQQCSTRFINQIKTAAAQSLVHAVEHESAHIPERQRNTFGQRLKSAFGVLGL